VASPVSAPWGRWSATNSSRSASKGGDVNLYAYVGNAPLRFTDPFGLDKQGPFEEPWLPGLTLAGGRIGGLGARAITKIGARVAPSLALIPSTIFVGVRSAEAMEGDKGILIAVALSAEAWASIRSGAEFATGGLGLAAAGLTLGQPGIVVVGAGVAAYGVGEVALGFYQLYLVSTLVGPR